MAISEVIVIELWSADEYKSIFANVSGADAGVGLHSNSILDIEG